MKFPHIYPDPESRALRAALAEECGVSADTLLVGCGADELIDLLMRVILDPGDVIINTPPTFGMYAFDCAVNAGRVVDANQGGPYGSAVLAGVQAASRETWRRILDDEADGVGALRVAGAHEQVVHPVRRPDALGLHVFDKPDGVVQLALGAAKPNQ